MSGALLALSLLLCCSGCATLSYPHRSGLPPAQRDGIDVGPFIADVLLTGGLGLVLDFIHGTIYQPKKEYHGRGSDPLPKSKGKNRES
jgi:hypothetical protein